MAKKAAKSQDLFRGDERSEVQLPAPEADPSIVRHILYLDGKGRGTPYLSATESEEVAERFDNTKATAVWITSPEVATRVGVKVVTLTELRLWLRGEGRGLAKCTGRHASWKVKRALQLAEMNLEHLLDFREVPVDRELRSRVDQIFVRR